MRYRDAGVDIARSDALKRRLGALVRGTWTPAVRPISGGFAGVMRGPGPGRLLAATLDGVGTKLHLALAAGRVADAAADVVYHGADDLLVHGGRPLALLDYVAMAKLDPEVVEAVVDGLARACRAVGAVLLGGETAEMPDTYLPGVVDVAGCMIGEVAEGELLDGSRVRDGDAILGLASDGLHTNGFSLARRVLSRSGLSLDAPLPGGSGESVGEALLAPHRWYGPALAPLLPRVHALAHVTGGGIAGNLARVVPDGLGARLDAGAWARPAVFRWLIAAGGVPEEDARAALNLGIGMVAVVDAGDAAEIARRLAGAGERVTPIGVVTADAGGVNWTDAERA
ncbi:MAG TPA: phosphoribosylformylglycinamidine cyclo-ligase [Candidatus Eisenbacteria bacterium]|nr:phosphoribosylformylglycinamidine cyclo-ligase [Candidatus Eisenbacteria bacterium]